MTVTVKGEVAPINWVLFRLNPGDRIVISFSVPVDDSIHIFPKLLSLSVYSLYLLLDSRTEMTK